MKKSILLLLFLITIFVLAGCNTVCESGSGCYKRYTFVCKECKTINDCPDCNKFCESKGKEVFEGGTSWSVPLKGIKKLPNGTIKIETGDIRCQCNCK